MPRNQLLSKIDMDFNSNDEYLKAFPPNFCPKLEGLNVLNQLPVSDFQVQKVLPKHRQDNIEETCLKQMPEESTCLYKELECVKVQESTQVHIPILENKGDEMVDTHKLRTLCKEDESSLAQSKINEPMLQVEDTTPGMEMQRDNEEMLLGESDGERSDPPRGETALPPQAMEASVFGGETFSDAEGEGTLFAIEITQETTVHCEAPTEADGVITIGAIQDSIQNALDDIVQNYEAAEKSGLEEAMEVATMKDETLGIPTLREFVEGTAQIFLKQEGPNTTDTDRDSHAMDTTEPLQDVPNERPDASSVGQIEIVESDTTTTTTLIETSESADAGGQIESGEPVAVEMIQTTTIRATYDTPSDERTEHTEGESEVLETEDAAIMAFEITEKTTIKAKAVCPYNKEEEPASNSLSGFDDLGACSDTDVDKVVDSIMNDIADIEADMEVEDAEVDMESNTQQPNFEVCGKAMAMESTALCQEYAVESMGSPS